MCLLITAFAAIVCYLLQKVIRFDISRLTMMFTSATIMWLVDCSFAKFDGDDFFDISYDDTLLGVTVVFWAIVLDLILRLPKIAHNSKIQNS